LRERKLHSRKGCLWLNEWKKKHQQVDEEVARGAKGGKRNPFVKKKWALPYRLGVSSEKVHKRTRGGKRGGIVLPRMYIEHQVRYW